jgi:NAD(P)-dependent dehydrogenase (short-subunit alcohol dehydrogenase family)
MGFLEGKTAIVTGGSRGIGRSISEALVAEGARVALCATTRDGAERAAAAGAPSASRATCASTTR